MMSPAGRRLHYEPDFPDLEALELAYEFLGELGRGGMAAVHLARRRVSGELVAVKGLCRRFANDEECVQRFEREALALASFDHPNIVRTIAVESTDSRTLAIVMEYLQGQTLREALRVDGAFGFQRAHAVLRDIAEALDHAHARGYVHRDVKPENIFLDAATGRARLADFGIARPMEGDLDLTLSGMSLGTPAYMSPEQIDGAPLDARSDIYSLGILGWELLSGRKPWEGENLYGILYRQKNDDLPSLATIRPGVPPSLLRAIEGAMRKRTGARWTSARQFLDVLLDVEQAPGAGVAAGLQAMNDETLRFHRPFDAWIAPAIPDDEAVVATEGATSRSVPSPAVLWREVPAPPPSPSPPFVPADPPWELSVPGAEDTEAERSAEPSSALALAVILIVMFVMVAAIGERRQTTATGEHGPMTMLSMGGPTGLPSDPILPGVTDVERSVARVRDLRSRRDSLAACRTADRAHQHACLRALGAPVDARVEGAFASLLAVRRAAAGITSDSADTPTLRRTRVQQRAWMIERDVECSTRHPDREGELWAQPRADCLAVITDDRIRELLAELRQSRPSR